MEPLPPRPPDPLPVLNLDEAIKRAKLREGPPVDDLSPEEQSIVEDILASDAIQVRFKNWLIVLVIGALEASPLKFLPFKRRVLAFVYGVLMDEVDDLVDKVKRKLND